MNAAGAAFLDAYELNRDEQDRAALEGSVLFEPLEALMREKSCWEGTCRALLERLTGLGAAALREVDEQARGGSRWTVMVDPQGTVFCVCPAREE